jgi:inorganic pyrophosphatase
VADFNQILTPGDVVNGMVNVVVEIPVGGVQKIEWNRTSQTMEVDRLEPTAFSEPTNYGFIPQTIGGDGDGLDVLIISETVLATGTTLPARIIGVMKFSDEGEPDDKIVVVPIADQEKSGAINSLADLQKQKIDQISDYFSHYKDQIKSGLTVVQGWGDIAEAKAIIYQAIERWNDTKNN